MTDPNIYLLWDGAGSAPTGWTEIDAAYQNKMILLGATALDTGGSDTAHTHTFASYSAGSTAPNIKLETGGGQPYCQTHSHNISSSPTEGTGSHVPAYKNFRCIYRSTTGWTGSIPSGAITMCDTVPTGWARHDDGSSYFIRIAASAGGTNGSASHTHSVVGSTDGPSSSSTYPSTYVTNLNTALNTHTHSFSGSTASTTNDYYYAGAGMVKASADTMVVTGIYALFDGTPDAHWDAVSATGYYMRCASGNTYASGGSYTSQSHSHSYSFASGASSSNALYWNVGTSALDAAGSTHAHTVSGNTNTANVQPAYVKLLLYKANSSYITTNTTTYTMDVLIKKLDITATATIDILIKKKNINLTYTMDALLQKTLTKAYTQDVHIIPWFTDLALNDVDVIVVDRYTTTYTMDLLNQKAHNATYDLDVLILAAGEQNLAFDSDLVLIQRRRFGYGATVPVIKYDITGSYGMQLEISNKPRHYTQYRDLPPKPATVVITTISYPSYNPGEIQNGKAQRYIDDQSTGVVVNSEDT